MRNKDGDSVASANKVIDAIKAAFPKNLRDIFPLPTTLKVVDVGANPIDGESPYDGLLASGKTEIIGFEPNLEALARLNAKKGSSETYLPYAIADGGRHTLNICAMPGMTSLLEPNDNILPMFFGFSKWARVIHREEIETRRLDDVPETAGLDLLKIDIQGAELMALQNATVRLSTALVVHTEVEFWEMYKGQPLFADIDAFMRAQGFLIHKFDPIYSRDFAPILMSAGSFHEHSQILWADAVYLRDVTRLDLLAPDQLLRMAEILYDCYQSYDLVLVLLREHDKRTGGDYGAKFFDVVRQLTNRGNAG